MGAAGAKPRGLERGQALIVALGAMFIVMLGAGVLAALGGALAQKGRLQRATDLAALSAARSMRDDFARLFEPPVIDGRPNPRHLAQARRTWRAHGWRRSRPAATTASAWRRPTSRSRARLAPGARQGEGEATAPRARRPTCRSTRPPTAELVTADRRPATARGRRLGYTGPLAYRQGKPMRPDVARAFDRMEAAARADGVRADRHLRLPLRRRAGGAVRAPSRPEVGRAAGQVAAPLRHRARPRPAVGLRLARAQRRPLPLRPALLAGSRGTTATR